MRYNRGTKQIKAGREAIDPAPRLFVSAENAPVGMGAPSLQGKVPLR